MAWPSFKDSPVSSRGGGLNGSSAYMSAFKKLILEMR